jgi:23S rRNA (cytidine1920-2'-O)/16S rRNA (cytidine1409-2'-O)-methyltransferase
LTGLVTEQHPLLGDPAAAISSGLVQVDGAVLTNPAARVRRDAVIKIMRPPSLRGAGKLEAALDHFDVSPEGRAGLDLGACTGGFTSVLLARGAATVYAVDAGHGQLLGSIRQDPRVRNLERTNLGDLDRRLVPETIGVVTMDLSYLASSEAVGQIEAIEVADGADLVILVKPMYELGLASLPTEPEQLDEAVERATAGAARWGWEPSGFIESPVRGSRGAVEFLLHARRSAGTRSGKQP